MWEELPSDGATYRCSVHVFIDEAWQCPLGAITAITEEALKAIRLPLKVKLSGRAVCRIHQNTLTGFSNRV